MPQGNLHQYAVEAEANLEKLATGLAQAGADEGTVKVVEQMADVTRKIVKALGKGQEETPDNEPPEEEEKSEPEQPQKRETMDSATSSLHQEAQRRAQERGE